MKAKKYTDLLDERLREDAKFRLAYLRKAKEEGAATFMVALADVVRAGNTKRITEKAGVSRGHIYRKPENLSFSKVESLLEEIGIRLELKKSESSKKKAQDAFPARRPRAATGS